MTGRTPSHARRARLIAGSLVSVVAAAGLAAATLIPWPQITHAPVSLSAAPTAAASVTACSGPVLAAGAASGDALALADAAGVAVVAATDGAEPERTDLAAGDVAGGAGPSAFTALPVGGNRVDVAAAQWAQVQQEALRGLTAEACTRPAMESWLVGGSATTGAADLVLLANPGSVAARVTLSAYGAQGATDPAAGADLLIPAGTQRVVALASLALGEESPIIRVTASEAPVRASLQTSITRVLVPGGVDQVTPAAPPAPALVIPGVRVTQDSGTAGDSEVPSYVRLLAPVSDGSATVTVLGAGGVVRQEQTVDVLAGIPLQLDLDGLPAGTYAVRVDATTPVTGAVWSTTGFSEGDDFGWFTAAEPVTGSSLFAVADAPDPVLTLVATDADASVELVDAAGAGSARTITVPAGRAISVPVAAGSVYRLDASGGVYAAVGFEAAQALAGYPVAAGDAEAAAITVYPR